MKPISLKLSGLQSYREMQEIDFAELSDTGLFGIFGPTGSGKSTLLDAITLAMYGKVGRAANGTQGIMNHSEDSLFVAFTFELVSAQGTERYRVERRFKRQNELSVSNTISRFIEIAPEGEKVLADKLAEVTRLVEEKIGLKMDDFTRAVVLPQGKFAEFLSLKGADRRQMLQRLFHLEKYGDQLGQKLSRKVKETDQALKELAAEQQGLGTASEEALKAAEKALKAAGELAKARRKELGAARERFETLAKVRELSQERGRRAALLASLRERDGAVRELEARLARAAAAESLRPVLAAWNAARQQAAERQATAARAAEAAAAAAAAFNAAAANAEAATGALSREEPALLLRLDQLEQAKLLQQECAQLAEELRELQSSRERLAAQRKTAGEELQKEEQLLARAKQRQLELEQLLKDCAVSAAERQRVQLADRRRQEILRLREEAEKAQQAGDRLRAKVDQSEAKLSEIAKREQAAVALSKALADDLNEHIRQSYKLQNEMKSAEEAVIKAEADIRARLKNKEHRWWAARLAEQLKDGDPCPVCGSSHHPATAAALEEADGDEAKLEQLAGFLSDLRELKQTATGGIGAGRSLLEALDIPDAEAVLGEDAGVERLETAAAREHDDAQALLLLTPEEARDRLSLLGNQLERLRERMDELQPEVRQVKNGISALQAERSAAQAEAAANEILYKQALETIRSGQELLAAKTSEWEQEHPDMALEEAERLGAVLEEKDRQADDLKQRLAASVPFIEEKAARQTELNREIVEMDKLLLQQEAQEQGKQTLLQEKTVRLHAWIGESGRSAEEMLPETRRRLDELRREAEQSRIRLSQADAGSREAAEANALAGQAAQTAREQETQCLERWQTELGASPFESDTEVLEAYMEPGRAEEAARKIKLHRDEEREHEITLKELDAKLDGRSISEEEWEASRQALELAVQSDEAALQAKARAERDLEDIQARHVRWKEIEAERLRLEHRSGLLGKLQSALRGNAFVEYVAEEQLMNVSHAASQRLRSLTKQRYALETDSGGGFVICDDANGGVKRPVATLSGGETFLTSLALALALSAQIQLRGQYPLQFFFLDEGFGTLDPELLDTVITSLEHLHHDHLAVGLITHVAELRSRLARRLIVIPAESAGEGSRVMIERM